MWTQEQKLAVVLEMMKGGDSMSAIGHRHGVAMHQAYRWRDAVLAGGRQGLLDRRNPQHRDPVREEHRKLKELVGSPALLIEAQTKLAGLLAEDGSV
jgi:transposase-like protein